MTAASDGETLSRLMFNDKFERSDSFNRGTRSDIDLMMIENALDKPFIVVDIDNSDPATAMFDGFEPAIPDLLLGAPSR